MSESDVHEKVSSSASGNKPYEDGQNFQDLAPEGSVKMTSEENLSASQELIAASDEELRDQGGAASSSGGNESSVSPASISAEVHHVCQVIKSYISGHQLQSMKLELKEGSGTSDKLPSSTDSSVCACGGADCIEARDIREWLQTSNWDSVLQKLVLTLGVTCLGLSDAYEENGELPQALKIIESACYICGTIPQHLEDTKFISPMVSEGNEKTIPGSVGAKDDKSSSADESLTFGKSYSTKIFWATAWMIVGDVYLKFKNCSSCSSEDCTFLSDRASSGSSASIGGPCSAAETCSEACERKQRKILQAKAKGSPYSLLGDPEDDSVHHKMHGIFKYLRGPFVKDEVRNYLDALICYGEARKALAGLPSDSEKLQLLDKKENWVRNALEEIRLSREAVDKSINWFYSKIFDDTNNA